MNFDALELEAELKARQAAPLEGAELDVAKLEQVADGGRLDLEAGRATRANRVILRAFRYCSGWDVSPPGTSDSLQASPELVSRFRVTRTARG